ncbi:hypothetical protein AAC387_Pa05g0554 [Persea americana]
MVEVTKAVTVGHSGVAVMLELQFCLDSNYSKRRIPSAIAYSQRRIPSAILTATVISAAIKISLSYAMDFQGL